MKTEGYGYVVGAARIKSANPIAQVDTVLQLYMCYEPGSGRIVEAKVNGVLDVTTRFLQDILVGRSILYDRDVILSEISRRYMGGSRAMLAIAVKDAYNKVRNRTQAPKSES